MEIRLLVSAFLQAAQFEQESINGLLVLNITVQD